ncbi:MAG TPA: tetratricopeptide repeat protein, partial [Chthoniobacterales bacterium]|nr:tetratricopeptide repeat protein [Chthoniobacterales bacterium]
PLFLLAAISCVMTIWAQSAGIASSDKLPFVLRIENAIVSCVVYIGETFWPVRLAAFYPHPENALKIWQVALAFALLLSVSLSAVALRKRCGYFFAGWFWYLVMLLPVIGLVQVGMQGHADRYTYLPQIGLVLMISWAVADFFASRSGSTKILAPVSAIAILIALASCSFKQVSFWRDSESLWIHTLAVTSNNAIAHNQFGDFLFNRGRIDEAIVQFEKSINVRPGYAEAQDNLGVALTTKGRFDSAAIHLKQAVELRPGQPKAHYDLANALSQQGERSAAIAQYQQALTLNPNYVDAHFNLATALARDRQIDAAQSEYQKAIADNPKYAEAYYALGNIFFEENKSDDALKQYQEALKNRPDYPEVENNIALVLLRKGQPRDAAGHWRRSLELRPDFTESLNNLAWLLATFPDDTLRNGTEAVALAERAQQISGGKDPSILRTLAAAYAETGRFAEAIDTAQRGVRLSVASENSGLAEIFERDLISYRANTPIRTALEPTN